MISEVIKNAALTNGASIATLNNGHPLTFQAFNSFVNASANTLIKRGVKPGERVMFYAPNSEMTLALITGIAKIGAIAVPIDAGTKLGAVININKMCPADHVFDDTRDLFASSGEEPSVGPVNPDDICLILNTSGTTGKPKFTAVSQRALGERVSQANALMALGPSDVVFLGMASYSAIGLRYAFGALSSGNTVVVDCCQQKRETIIANADATHIVTMAWELNALSNNSLFGFPSVKRVIANGKAGVAGVAEFKEKFPMDVTLTYGLNEAGTVSAISADYTDGKVGRPVDGVEIVLDGDEIVVRMPGLADGYFVNGEIKPLKVADGWFHTGDKGYVDDNGDLFITGRKPKV